MASLMSGLYPFEHQVRHSIDSMSSEINTHAKEAIKNGYKTFFYSSSPEIMSKNGFNQGFNSFDDGLSKNKLYRNLEENLKSVKKNLSNEASENSYHIIHVSDLARDSSQLENMDLAFGDFFNYLKKNNLWNNSIVMLIGLQGKILNQEDLQDPATSFKKNTTRVSFLFKNKQKTSEQSLKWQIDKTVNLADIGHTLLDLFEAKNSNIEIKNQVTDINLKKYQTSISLKNVILENTDLDFSNRAFLIENFWQQLQIKKNNFNILKKIATSYSIRQDSQLLVLTEKELLFNSLMDPLETISTSSNSDLVTQLFKDLRQIEKKSNHPLEKDSARLRLISEIEKSTSACQNFESIKTLLETKEISKSIAKLDFIKDRYDHVFNFESLEKLDILSGYVLDYNYSLKKERLCLEYYLNLPEFNSLKLQLSNPKR